MRHSARGFTLIELLVALAVFAVMAAMAYAGLQGVLRTRAHADAAGARLLALQTAMLIVDRDLAQAVDRPVRDELGTPVPAFAGSGGGTVLAQFTRASGTGGAGGSGLQRVEYRLRGGTLERHAWATLDRSQGARAATGTLLDGVAGLDLRFLGRDWTGYWPPAAGDPGRALPRAVELRLVLDAGTVVRRLFIVAG